MVCKSVPLLSTALCLLTSASVAIARGHNDHGTSGMEPANSTTKPTNPLTSRPAAPEASASSAPISLTYFTHSGYSGLLLAHIGLMIVAWFFVLPICALRMPRPFPKMDTLLT